MRRFRSAPLLSCVAIVSLALGIGANTAIFSIINGLLLKPLPVRDPNRLAVVASNAGARTVLTYPIWEEISRRRELFDGTAAWAIERFDLSARGQSDFVDGMFVSGAFFDALGLPAEIGRVISPLDDRPGYGPDGPVAILSEDFWRRRFGRDPAVIGRPLTIGRHTLTIVGVAPRGFSGLEVGSVFDVVVPFAAEPLLHGNPSLLSNRSGWWVNGVVRRKSDHDVATSVTALRAVQPAIRTATVPQTLSAAEVLTYLTEPFDLIPASRGISPLRDRYQRPLTMLMVVVVLVLFIACVNVANLLLARTAARRHELGVRRALGASTGRLARQFLSESLFVSALGATLGLAFAIWGSHLIVRQLSTVNHVVSLDLSVDWRVLAFTAGAAVFTALLFGTVPALQAIRVQPNEILEQTGRVVATDRRWSPSQLLIIVQVALSLVLVVAAGLFIRTFVVLMTQNVGFVRNNVLTVRVDANTRGVASETVLDKFERFRTAAAEVPGVESAAISAMTPLNGTIWQFLLELPDGPFASERDRTIAANLIGPDYFKTLGSRLLAGREFTRSDGPFAPPVAIVNASFAKKFFNGQPAVGRHIRQAGYGGRPSTEREIVGYVEDSVYQTLRDASVPAVYLPLAQRPQAPPSINISVRAAAGSPAQLTGPVVRAIAREDPDARLAPRLLADQVESSVVQERLVAMLSGFFGVLAVLLAGIGLYGVSAYHVDRRRTEIGVRMALGAAPDEVARMILGRLGVQVGIGVAAGAAVSFWAARFVASLLYGVAPRDPVTLTVAAITFAVIAALAGWVPACHAARIDPAQVLRQG